MPSDPAPACALSELIGAPQLLLPRRDPMQNLGSVERVNAAL